MHLEPKMMLSGAPYLEKDGDQGQVKETICLSFSSIPGDPTDPKKHGPGKTDRNRCIVFLREGKKKRNKRKTKKATQKTTPYVPMTDRMSFPTQHPSRNEPAEPNAFITALKDGLYNIKQTLFDQSAAKTTKKESPSSTKGIKQKRLKSQTEMQVDFQNLNLKKSIQ
jgi:hypothetical protein